MTRKHAAITCFGRATANRAIALKCRCPGAGRRSRACGTCRPSLHAGWWRYARAGAKRDYINCFHRLRRLTALLRHFKRLYRRPRGPAKAKAMWNAVLEAGQFTYTEQFQSYDTIVILFNIRGARDIELEAVDVLRINEDGKCREIYAMARPYQPMSLLTGRVALAF